MKLIIMIGKSGSGKSTYVDQYLNNYQLINHDDILKTIGGEFFTTWANFYSKKKYYNVSAVQIVGLTMCEALMKRKRNIVIDNLNTDIKDITIWLDLADKYNYKKQAIVFGNIDKNLLNRFHTIKVKEQFNGT